MQPEDRDFREICDVLRIFFYSIHRGMQEEFLAILAEETREELLEYADGVKPTEKKGQMEGGELHLRRGRRAQRGRACRNRSSRKVRRASHGDARRHRARRASRRITAVLRNMDRRRVATKRQSALSFLEK